MSIFHAVDGSSSVIDWRAVLPPSNGQSCHSEDLSWDGVCVPEVAACDWLQRRLVEARSGTAGRSAVRAAEQEITRLKAARSRALLRPGGASCFEEFLFEKRIRKTKECIDWAQPMTDIDAQIASQRKVITVTDNRSAATRAASQDLELYGCAR
jgi:hypothetical protein